METIARLQQRVSEELQANQVCAGSAPLPLLSVLASAQSKGKTSTAPATAASLILSYI